MNASDEKGFANASREEIMSALFANLVLQTTNMALMFLGKVANPETGEKMKDLEAAKMFIDQLEMLGTKTKGNLSKEEERLLQQSLTHLRLSFVEAVEQPAEPKPSAPAAAVPPGKDGVEPASPESTEEARKRFSKKY